MKKNSGSALTSVIVIFLLVTMIGVPVLSMVVYNYRLREYDSGIKEAEYKNEIVMDRIATIIKNEVIAAISFAKENSTSNMDEITKTLVNSYKSVYDEAYDKVIAEHATYDANKEINNESVIKDKLKEELELGLKEVVGEYEGTNKDAIVDILGLDEKTELSDLSTVKIDNERLDLVCNNIFKTQYQDELISKLFVAIYKDSEYDDLATNRLYGDKVEFSVGEDGKILASSLRVTSKYERNGDSFNRIYNKDDIIEVTFDADGKLEIGIESKYKLNTTTPLSTLSAIFIIGTPEFGAISSIEQQTIALSNPTLDYGLIAGDTLTVNGEVKVAGNVLARANGASSDSEIGILINSGASFSEEVGDEVRSGRIATSGDIIMHNNTKLITGTNPIYYRNLYLGDPEELKNTGTIDVEFNGDVLAKDDLEINLDSTVNVTQNAGSYFGYNDKNDEGPDSSSAIVVNSNNISNIRIKLKDLYLAGRAFIEDVRSTNRTNIATGENMIYKTGESISVKGNYVAYQTPLVGTTENKYDVDKVKFSSYFMLGSKEGIGNTNVTLNLVDSFIDEINYENFDSQHKWEYFTQYAGTNAIKKPSILAEIKYIEGAGINNNNVIGKSGDLAEQAAMITKGKRFDEFTSMFGYASADNKKIVDWIKFGSTDKIAQQGNFFTYISKQNAGNRTVAWGTVSNGADIFFPNTEGVNGIIIHDGDLTIRNTSNIPFKGIIIATGSISIESDMTLISDKDAIANIIIQNYLGNEFTYEGRLNTGDLFNTFTYDGSGTTYVAIDVTDRSNMININELVGITNWKKTNYGRL